MKTKMKIHKTLTFILIWGLVYPQSLLSKETKKKSQQDKLDELYKTHQGMKDYLKYQKPMEDALNAQKIEVGQAKYGLKCLVPEAFPQDIIGLCPDNFTQGIDSIPPYKQAMISTVIARAREAIANYETEASVVSENIDTGRASTRHAACLKDELLNFERDVLDARLNRIDAMMAKIDDDHEEFMRKNKVNEDFIKKKYNDMYLGRGVDYKKRFNKPACRSINTPDEFQSLTGGKGLKAILDKTVDNRANSDKFIKDSRSIRQDIKNSITRAAQRASNTGIFEFDKFDTNFNIGSSINKTSTFQAGIADLQSKVKEYFSQADRQLQSVLDVNGVDKDIYQSLTGKSSSSGGSESLEAEFRNWQNQREQKCFYDTFGSNGAQTINTVIDKLNLQDRNTTQSIRSSQAKDLSNKIKSILNDTGMGIASKVKKIQQYINNNPGMEKLKVRLGTPFRGQTGSHYWSAGDLVSGMKNECYARMNSKSYGARPGKSLKSAIQLVKRLKNGIQRKQASFAREFANELEAKVLTCKQTNTGEAEIKRSCDAKSMVVEGEFCFRHANDCAKDTKKCLGNMQKAFDKDKTALTTRIQEYNKTLLLKSQTQYNLFKQLRNIYSVEAKAFQGQFSNATYELPKDIKSEIPKEQDGSGDLQGLKNELGVGMIDPAEFKEKIQEKLEKLRESIVKQNDGAKEQVAQYVKDTIASFTTAKEKWIQIRDRCQAIVNAMTQQKSGEGIVPNAPLCASGEFEKSIIDNTDQVQGIIQTLADSKILEELDKEQEKSYQSYFKKNVNNVFVKLKMLDKKIAQIHKKNELDPLDDLDDEDVEKRKNKSNGDSLTTMEEKEIYRHCESIRTKSFETTSKCSAINCSDFSLALDLRTEINSCMKEDLEVLNLIIEGDPGLQKKLCSNQASGPRGQGKTQNNVYGNEPGAGQLILNSIFGNQ